MFINRTFVSSLFAVLLTFTPMALLAHHMAPEEMQDFITDQLIAVDSPHLLSSDEDPSLLDVMVDGIEDLDYVVVSDGLSASEVTNAYEIILEQLAVEDDICGVKYVSDYDLVTETFTLTVYADFCTV
jgi:hypothetical protein